GPDRPPGAWDASDARVRPRLSRLGALGDLARGARPRRDRARPPRLRSRRPLRHRGPVSRRRGPRALATRGGRMKRLVAPLIASCVLSACAPQAPSEAIDHQNTPGVVAVVDGAPIHRDEVVRLARATGRTSERALEQLVAERLLDADAKRRGLEARPDVRLAPKRALAQLVLRDLEADVARAGVPDADRVVAQRAALEALIASSLAET